MNLVLPDSTSSAVDQSHALLPFPFQRVSTLRTTEKLKAFSKGRGRKNRRRKTRRHRGGRYVRSVYVLPQGVHRELDLVPMRFVWISNLSRLPRTPSRTLWGWHEVFAVRVGLDEEGGVNAQRRTRDEGIASVAHEI